MASNDSKLNVALFLKQDENGNVIHSQGQEVDLNNYALKSELNIGLKTKANIGELTKYVLASEVDNLLDTKLASAGFIKNNQLVSLATKKSVDDLKIELTTAINNLNNFNPATLNNYATKASLGNYATTAQVRDKLGREEAEDIYLKKVDLPAIPDLTEFTTYSYVDARVTTKTDELEGRLERKMLQAIKDGNIQLDVSNLLTTKAASEIYAKKSDLIQYAKLSDLDDIQINTSILSNYVKNDSLNNLIQDYLTTIDLVEMLDKLKLNKAVDLSAYYTKIDVDRLIASAVTGGQVDLSNYDTSIQVDTKIQAVNDKMLELEGIVATARGEIRDAVNNIPNVNDMVTKETYDSKMSSIDISLSQQQSMVEALLERQPNVIEFSTDKSTGYDDLNGYWEKYDTCVVYEYFKDVRKVIVNSPTGPKEVDTLMGIAVKTEIYKQNEDIGFIIQELTIPYILDTSNGTNDFAQYARYCSINRAEESSSFGHWDLKLRGVSFG